MVTDISQFIPSLGLIILLVAIFAEVLIAIMVLRSNVRSATNIIFFLLSIFTVLWLVVSYLVNLKEFYIDAVLLARFGIFFAAPMSSLFFLLAHTIPDKTLRISRRTLIIVVTLTFLIMALNLSPYAFTDATSVIQGSIHPTPGIGFIPFGALSTVFSVLAVYLLAKKFHGTAGGAKSQMKIVLLGTLIMLALVIATILVPILVFNSGMFVIFTPIYTLVFLSMTAYAIVQYGLFNLKVIATEGLTAAILITPLANIFVPATLTGRVVNSFVFVVTAFLGFVLIGSVRREVRQREELQQLTKKLEAANEQLKVLSRFKTQLLSLASHQLRSPLAAIKGFISLVAQGAYGPIPEKAGEALGKVGRQAEGLIGLIGMLLDLRKIEEGRMEYRLERTDLNKLTTDVVNLLRPLAEAKKLEFTLTSPGGEIPVSADGEKLKQVIQNLTDNAIKYTASGYVRVNLKQEGKTAILSVADSGLGVSATLLPHLFEEFIRDERVKNEIMGTGLGLYIASKIAESHGGKLWAESAGEGKGSTFYMSMPIQAE